MEIALFAYLKKYPVHLKGVRELAWGIRESVDSVSLPQVERTLKEMARRNKISFYREVNEKMKTVTEGYKL